MHSSTGHYDKTAALLLLTKRRAFESESGLKSGSQLRENTLQKDRHLSKKNDEDERRTISHVAKNLSEGDMPTSHSS